MRRAFVIDFLHTDSTGAVHVYDLDERRRVASLPTRYAPEIAPAADGSLVVADFHGEVYSQDSEIRLYDRELRLSRTFTVGPRTRYNVRPSVALMAVTADGRDLVLVLIDTVGNDLAHNHVAALDLARGTLRAKRIKLAENAFAFGLLDGGPRFFVAEQGRELAGLGWGDPLRSSKLDAFHELIDTRGRGWLGAMAAAAATPDGKKVAMVSREARLAVADLPSRKFANPPLAVPSGMVVSLAHLALGGGRLFVGLASRESASLGRSQAIHVFAWPSLRKLHEIVPRDPASQLALTDGGRSLALLSDAARSLALFDAATGKQSLALDDVAAAPVWMAFTSSRR